MIGEVVTDEVFVRGETVRLTLIIIQLDLGVDHFVIFGSAEELLDNHRLHFEATHVTVVDHDGESLTQNLCIHELVEVCCHLWHVLQDNDKGVHGLEPEVH